MKRWSDGWNEELVAANNAKRAKAIAIADGYSPHVVVVAPTTSPSKYGNVKTLRYASQREAARAAELSMLQKAGRIKNLREQVPFLLLPKQDGEREVFYKADFVYEENGKEVVEDSKGCRTDVYILKRKLMLMVHGIRILET